MIKNIVFDIGNVLVSFRYHDYMKDLGFSDEATKIFEDRIVLNELWDRFDLGIEDDKDILRQMAERVPEYEKECKQFFGNIVDIVSTYSYTVPWIESLKKRGYKIYLLSNYPKSMFELHEKERFGFTHLADGKVVSAMVKMSKPDPAIYRYLLDTYNLKAEECLFIDDRPVNVEAAKKIGFHSFVFTSYEEANKKIDNIQNNI